VSEAGLTNCHCHTAVDWVCEEQLVPELYDELVGTNGLRRVVITDHGFMFYWFDRDVVFGGQWMTDPALFERNRDWGNRRLEAGLARIRRLGNPNLFAGIETDLTRYGMLTHDSRFTEQFDLIIGSIHFLPWLQECGLAPKQRLHAWFEHVERLIFTPQVDVLGHPLRWWAQWGGARIPEPMLAELANLAEQSGITMEINVLSQKNLIARYADMFGSLLKRLRDRGLPIVLGTDAHGRAAVNDFSRVFALLKQTGTRLSDLNVLEVEDFLARKGDRDRLESRPRRHGA